MEYYHNLVTERSWQLLKNLQRKYKFILIGGWAVFVWTKAMKSKDIDIVVDYTELEKFRQDFEIYKNERLKKYEIKKEEVDIDIYTYHYSNPGLPAEEISSYTVSHEGFRVPIPEILLILKQAAYQERKGRPKGEKDKVDILCLLGMEDFEFEKFKSLLLKFGKEELVDEVKNLLGQITEVKELDLNQYQISKLKKRILAELS